MKKFFSVFMIAVCCMALAMPAQAQLIKFGVKGGVNLSKLKFEGMKDNSTGFFFGPMAEITIPVIGLGVDGALLYSQKGDKMEGLDMKQSGLDIPVNLKYSIGLGSMLGIYVAAGPTSSSTSRVIRILKMEESWKARKRRWVSMWEPV